MTTATTARGRRRLLVTVARHAGLLGVATVFVAPLVVMLLTALMSDRQADTGSLLPHPFRWGNFHEAIRVEPLLHYAGNTLILATLTTGGVVVSSVPVAYALSRVQWRGREAVLLAILATVILPLQVIVLPSYVLFAKLHWIGTLKPILVPAIFGNGFSIFLLRQHFLTIPPELSDVARLEGAGELAVLWKVVVPLGRPAIIAVALFNFIYVWNDFFVPLVYLGSTPHLWTLSLGLANFRTSHHVDWNLTMAASTLTLLPVLVVFLLAQRALIESIALTGAPRD